MKKRRDLCIERLEPRATPGNIPIASGIFLPPGLIRGYEDPNLAPPPVQVGLDGAITFLPPALTRGVTDPNQ